MKSARGEKDRPESARLIAVVGPTAVGKSDLALKLALEFAGEIVSADSRQIYRYMDIGTAKPTPEERRAVPHHLIDLVDPDQEYTLADYQRDAYQAIDDVMRRGRLPFLVGGTGLYVRAVLEGLVIPRIPPDPEFRRLMEERAQSEGAGALHRELLVVDPVAAAKIDPRNVRRVIRALEVYHHTAKPISELQRTKPPLYDVLIIGLTCGRDELYRRIDERVDWQISEGLVNETQRLVAMGYGYNLPSMSGLGYRQIGMYLRGEVTLEAAIQLVKNDTHRFARQQYTWFRLDDPKIRWIQRGPNHEDQASEFLRDLL
ncbi:MAG: tRNA (adenosine(37)-N6)-dimethylallyltransferase MiaA, partial [Chloroflexi bacterium]|nr:tRNA (adenosine(37)-N6)-dimethylallyltransferase MiaA [Chloroflexota bacterium]